MALPIRQGATHKVVIGPVVAVGDGFTPITTLALSTADEAEVILHDNGTVVDISAYTFAAITTADGYYHLTLQTGISNTVGHMTVVINDDSLCLPVKADFVVIDTAAYDAIYKDAATMDVNVITVAGTSQTANDNGADINTLVTQIGTAGDGLTAINLPDQTMNITGNLSGSVGSVAGNVDGTVASVVSKTGYVLSSTGADLILSSSTFAAAIADAIWDELMAGHVTVDTAGLVMNELQDAGRIDALIDAIKTVTDKFVFTVANQVDANTLSVGGTTQTANDMSGDCNTIITNLATAQTDLTTITGADGVTIASAQDLTATMKASVNTEVDNALTDYDGPTNAEMEARTPTAAQLLYMTRHAATAKPVTFSDGGNTTTAILANVDGVAASANNDHYNGRVLIFNAGTLDEVATNITDYVGATKTATVTAVPFSIVSSHTAVLV